MSFYTKLMALNPTSLGKMTNSKGQIIEFYEHPIHGDGAPVVCVWHEGQKAHSSTFYETTDMEDEHREYEPTFEDGKFLIGGFED